MNHAFRALTLLIAASTALIACDDGADGDTITGFDDGAPFQVVLRSQDASGLQVGARSRSVVSAPDVSRATIPLDQIESITLPLGAVEAHLEGAGWIDAGAVNDDIDLLSLPADGIELVDGDLPEGSYTGLRFFLTGQPTITLASDVTVGRTLYAAGTHDLVIPSSGETGLKLNADFVVDADGQILTVLFDGQASVRRVNATGSGTLILNPVLRVEDEDGDDVGELDDEEEDDGAEIEFEGVVASVEGDGFVLDDGTVVVIQDDTEIEGDILSLDALAAALADGEVVEAEGEGVAGDGGVVLATELELDVEEAEEEEVEGFVTSVDAAAGTFVVDDGETEVVVIVTADTVIEGDFIDLADVAEALALGTTVEAEAEGAFDEAGQLVATEVDFEVEEDD